MSQLSRRIIIALQEINLTSVGRRIIYSILIGIVAGSGAVIFHLALRPTSHFFLSVIAGYEPGISDIVVRRWLLVLLPAVGGAISGIIVYRFAPETEGPGIDAVIEAFHYKSGEIRKRVPIIKTIASVFTLGSGGSGGFQGPIAQIGAGFGSFLAKVLKFSERERRIMMITGMSAGIGAIFKAPLASAIFAGEVLYREEQLEHEMLIPATVASIVSYSIFSSIFGWDYLYRTPDFAFSHPTEFIPYTVLGVLCAIIGLGYIKSLFGVRYLFRSIQLPDYLKPAIGGLLTGVVGFFLPQVLGLGSGEIQKALDGNVGPMLLLAIVVGKVATTSFSIGSGGSGGVFGPSMVIGGTLGGFVGFLFHRWGLVMQPGAFVIVGMAGFFAGVANAPISTIIMVSEMTGNYNLLAPSMWVCIISFLLLKRWSIYEKQVANRISSPVYYGEFVVDVLEELRVRDWLTENVVSIPQQMDANQIAAYIRQTQHDNFPVLNQHGELIGALALRDIIAATFSLDIEPQTAGDLAEKEPITITPEQSLSEVLHLMNAHHRDFLPVLASAESKKLTGVFTRTDLMTAYDSVTERVRDMPRPRFGLPAIETVPIRELIRTEYDVVYEDTPLERILELEETSMTIDFPVIAHNGDFLGMISFKDFRTALMEQNIYFLIIAQELLIPDVQHLKPTDSLADALAKFGVHDFDCLPVMDANNPQKLAGIVLRSDVMERYRRAKGEKN